VLQKQRISGDKKRKIIEDNPLYANARKDADRMAKARRVARERDKTCWIPRSERT
jgi:hypothetical protein